MVGIINGIMTVVGLLTFLGIVWWAFSKGRRKANEEAAQLPFLLDDDAEGPDDIEKQQEDSHE